MHAQQEAALLAAIARYCHSMYGEVEVATITLAMRGPTGRKEVCLYPDRRFLALARDGVEGVQIPDRQPQTPTLRDKIVAVLAAADKPLKGSVLVRRCGVSPDSSHFRALLSKMQRGENAVLCRVEGVGYWLKERPLPTGEGANSHEMEHPASGSDARRRVPEADAGRGGPEHQDRPE